MNVEELVKEIRLLSREELEKLIEACDDLFLEFYNCGCYPEPYYQYDENGNKISNMLYIGPKHFIVTLSSVSQKVPTLKVLREMNSGLGLKDCRYIVEHLPFVLGKYVREDIAYDAKEKLEAVGAVVTLKEDETYEQ